MKIPLLDLVAQYHSIKEEMDAAVLGVLESGRFILGPNVAALEQEVAAYLGVKHAVGVASGTDALVIALRAAGVEPGDEVIVPSFSFFATAGTVMTIGACPVFVDINPSTYLIDVTAIEAVITPKTKAIIPVHLYGQSADMDELKAIAGKHGLKVIEDNAQALGRIQRKKTAALGYWLPELFPVKTWARMETLAWSQPMMTGSRKKSACCVCMAGRGNIFLRCRATIRAWMSCKRYIARKIGHLDD
jgi:dTDP-4-amino-4,6-dideoxygalactose transaminase